MGFASNAAVCSARASRALKRRMKKRTPPRVKAPATVLGRLKKRLPTMRPWKMIPPHLPIREALSPIMTKNCLWTNVKTCL